MTELQKVDSDTARIEQVKVETPPPKSPGRFKIMGRLVQAMKRWQSALNPTYTPGKRSSDQGQSKVPRLASLPRDASGVTSSGRALSGRTASGRPKAPGVHHGFKGNLLTQPLPPVTTVQQ